MSFKIADTPSTELRYYPFVEKTVGEVTDEEPKETPIEEPIETPIEDDNKTAGDNVSTDTPVEDTPVEEPTSAEKTDKTPGFGVVLGLVGLLAVVYLVRRNN